ncbi:parkin coregulated gene family protein [Pseudonocardia sp. McavD-2-B]|uniref:parkin coregulated gene family protein n=1 Tax=Pseudonocardia sp. McavD-2-B TaxID=2954499 RepID=UPI002096AF4C|nr:parkin coregulated gene family protein [Pseudonocardia sp. McavD-2-B]MCO7193953.1 parkin coregulated gene family protein [Pseudonocardia sp. McavD-2-B]
MVPETDGFGDRVRRELQGIGDQEIHVDVVFDVDRAQLRAELEAIRVPTIHVPVDLDSAGLARDLARLDAMTGDRKVTVNADLDSARLRSQIETATRAASTSVPVAVDVDRGGITALRAELATLRNQRVRVSVDTDPGPLRSVLSTMTGLGSVALSTASSVAGIAAGFVKVAGVAGAVAVGGAGITAAFGAAATAVAAVPAALGLAAAPIGAIVAGLDGIKKAAKSLEPAFDRLKSQVSGVFEKGLTPVFKSLDGLVRGTLTDGLKGTATSINGVASSLADMLNAMNRADQLGNIFRNINKAITDIGPGIVDIVNSTLRMMELTGGYDALTTAVNEFGRAYSDSVSRIIGDGSISRAFTGLESVLGSLSRAFVGLVENGIRGFAGAAPGISKVVDSLTGFFGRFDWERLGRASGAVFEGIGEIFDNVDDSTIEAITQAFERLGQVFQGADFQASIGKIVDALPALIDGLSWFVENGATVAGWIADIVSALGGDNIAAVAVGGAVAAAVWKGMKAASKLWKLKDLFGKGVGAKDLLPGAFKLVDLFDKAFKWTDLIGPAGDLASGLLRELLGLNEYTVEIDEGDLKEKVSGALSEAFQEALDGVFDDVPQVEVEINADPARQSIADAVAGGVADGLARVDTSGLAGGFSLTLDSAGFAGTLAQIQASFTAALSLCQPRVRTGQRVSGVA